MTNLLKVTAVLVSFGATLAGLHWALRSSATTTKQQEAKRLPLAQQRNLLTSGALQPLTAAQQAQLNQIKADISDIDVLLNFHDDLRRALTAIVCAQIIGVVAQLLS